MACTVEYVGDIAQLVEHLHGMQGVRGSNPRVSTIGFGSRALWSRPTLKPDTNFRLSTPSLGLPFDSNIVI